MVLQVAIVSEQQESFRVVIQTSGRVYIRDADVLRQGRAILFGGELRQNPKGFVKQNQRSHYLINHSVKIGLNQLYRAVSRNAKSLQHCYTARDFFGLTGPSFFLHEVPFGVIR